MKKVLIVSDNFYLINEFKKIIVEEKYRSFKFHFRRSQKTNLTKGLNKLKPICIKKNIETIKKKYDCIFSIHCKQIFPKELVENIPCYNIHPGYLPNNRGWFPQVFSIINQSIIGATIHEMDDKIDNGNIIARKKTKIEKWETSSDVYKKILNIEIKLLKKHLYSILTNQYSIISETNSKYYSKEDFNNLCKLDLEKIGSFESFYNLLRALTHKGYKNAHFIDENGNKIYLELIITKEKTI